MTLIIMLAFVLSFIQVNHTSTTKIQTGPSREPDVGVESRIIGGSFANITEYPFVAAIVIKKHHNVSEDALQCGGSIISTKWVLTAGHCIEIILRQGFGRKQVYVSAGNASWHEGRKHNIINWRYHEGFDNNTMMHDIGLIRVRQPFKAPLEKPITLPARGYAYKANTKVTVLGWGSIDPDFVEIQGGLRQVDVYIVSQKYCSNLLKLYKAVKYMMFCAGVVEGGRDVCTFDSGGPAFQNNILLGIISWGVSCGGKDLPGIYTRVNLYKAWITRVTRELKSPLIIQHLGRRKTAVNKRKGYQHYTIAEVEADWKNGVVALQHCCQYVISLFLLLLLEINRRV